MPETETATLLFEADDDELLLFDYEVEDSSLGDAEPSASWKVMIVDDESGVHEATRFSLRKFVFEEKSLHFVSAYSGAEARELIAEHPDTALVLLDVVMEETDSGLQVVKYIRETLANHFVRIILRTGQPGEAPADSVVLSYDINDYKTKTELTHAKLFTTVLSALRSYRDLTKLEENRYTLAQRNEALEQMNHRLQAEINERKKLEAVRIEKERLRLEKEFLEKQSRELAKLNADKDKFFSIVAHDLKGPLTPLLGNAELLSQMIDMFSQDEIRMMSEVIYRSAHRVLNLLQNLLQWARIQMGRMEYEPQPFDLHTMVSATISFLVDTARAKKITLHNQVATELFVEGDRNMISTVLRNVIANAIKFTHHQGDVTITAEPDPDQPSMIRVGIRDTGVGISQANIDKLFKIDKHHTTTGTDQEKGSGLGLILCKEMINMYGGRIWMESVINEGTTVYFTVPQVSNMEPHL